jgi:hypothetical protein
MGETVDQDILENALVEFVLILRQLFSLIVEDANEEIVTAPGRPWRLARFSVPVPDSTLRRL